ncbi:MAG: peptidoglycan DD-metalloendopeptidase family protein [Bacilli bacterium]|nr:peptidoglycan DD-metalloendopeptidase family protein [Bacilli bacterium]
MRKRLVVIVLILILLGNIFAPIEAKATTLREYEELLEKYKNELNSTNNQIYISRQQLEEIQNKIADTERQIKEAEDEIVRLEEEIKKNNEEIAKKKEESKALIEYYQISNGENIYLEYAFGAESITDMIYRMSIVEQLTDYNDRVMKELKELIRQNEERQKELEQKKIELKELQEELHQEAQKVKGDISSMAAMIPDIKNQLSNYENRVNYYRRVGCQPDDEIGVDCDRGNNAYGFVRPVTGNYWISTYYYWNGYSGHKGIDYAQGCGNPVRAVANGRVYYVGSNKDVYHAKMILIVHNYNGRKVFSQYTHLSGYAVSENQDVEAGQVIGYVGTTGWSTGCHLHLEMSVDVGWDYNSPGNYYSSYVSHIVNPYNYVPND